ncbi:MAG: AAA family ATPase [Thermosphaera sp.]
MAKPFLTFNKEAKFIDFEGLPMVNVRVVNWRCIEDLELELARLNVFMGKNSTGKSSLAYAIYFASKSRTYDPRTLITQLYGCGFDRVARLVENRPQFPISIKLGDSEFSVKPSESTELPRKAEEQKVKEREREVEFGITKPATSPWTKEFLLPSKRISYIQVMMLVPKIMRELKAEPGAEAITRMLGVFMGSIFELLKALFTSPPFWVFVSDYIEALTGLRFEPIIGEMRDIGSYMVEIHPLLSLIELTTQDPYTKLQLPAELSADGLLDFSIFDSMIKRIPENSLVVIEEPEIHKNPKMVIEFTELIVERALDKKLTLIMTTHLDIPLLTLAKLVREQRLRVEDAKIYYFVRDPWTKLSEIKLHEDGTLERLPDWEEAMTYLF